MAGYWRLPEGWHVISRRRLAFGLVLSAASGMILGQAWTSQEGSWWWLGVLTLLSAALMALSAIYAGVNVRSEPVRRRIAEAETPEVQRIEDRWQIEPMLGEILVENKVVTPGELELALKRQQGSGLLLGEILVEMRLVSLDRLDEALREQSAWRDARRPTLR